jgi:ZIP family zinc transporter
MTFALTVVLGAIAGLTIYLGLPVARLTHSPRSLQAFLNALATGILFFLFWDVLTKASEPIYTALAAAQRAQPGSAAAFLLLLTLFVGGLGIGLLSLVYYERRVLARSSERSGREASGRGTGQVGEDRALSAQRLAFLIATGIGLHNFSEGLAIGGSARAGAISLATILIVGFGLHNMTEGFGIAAPLTTTGQRPSWTFLALVGLIGGGPTFLGTVLGYSIQSDAVFVLFLALAGGSILYVVSELLHVGRRFALREVVMWGIFLGFMAGYATDLIVTWGGA